jgi:hypothetical protein
MVKRRNIRPEKEKGKGGQIFKLYLSRLDLTTPLKLCCRLYVGQHFLLCQRQGISKRLHRGFAIAVLAAMGPLLVIFGYPSLVVAFL